MAVCILLAGETQHCKNSASEGPLMLQLPLWKSQVHWKVLLFEQGPFGGEKLNLRTKFRPWFLLWKHA